MEEEFSRINEYELAFYRRLGIRKFRDLTFRLERWKHRKDALRNSNYHLQQLSYRGAQRHYMYLSYNALIHLMGLVMAIMLILLRRAAGYRWTLADLGLSAAVLTNIYCIMLQRYNALRIRKYRYTLCKRIKKREEKNAVSLRKKLAEEAEEAVIRRDVEWISRAAQVIEENVLARKGIHDIQLLERIGRKCQQEEPRIGLSGPQGIKDRLLLRFGENADIVFFIQLQHGPP